LNATVTKPNAIVKFYLDLLNYDFFLVALCGLRRSQIQLTETSHCFLHWQTGTGNKNLTFKLFAVFLGKGETNMKKQIWVVLRLIVIMVIVTIPFTVGVSQAETDQQKKEAQQLRQDVQQQVTKQIGEMGMPILTGTTWQQSPQDDKVSFVWGFCHVVAIEDALMQKLPSLKVENFSAKVTEGLAGLKINDIVRTVDEYYAANPSKLDVPVVRVIWDTMVKPKLKTNIGGYPLQ